MAIDTLILGPFEFTDFAVPPNMTLGVTQQIAVHKMPGGARALHPTGPDHEDRRWEGILWGDDASSSMATLYAMAESGETLPFSWGAENRTCVIRHFEAKVERWTCIHYEITVVLDVEQDDEGEVVPLGVIVGADLSAALSALS